MIHAIYEYVNIPQGRLYMTEIDGILIELVMHKKLKNEPQNSF